MVGKVIIMIIFIIIQLDGDLIILIFGIVAKHVYILLTPDSV